MAPKAAPAHLVITGRVKGPPTISKDGSAVVVKKTLDDGATVQETFPKHRVRGKQKQFKQLIPVEDVVQAIQVAAEQTKRTERADGERRLSALQDLANRVVDQKVGEEKARTRFQRGRAAAANTATKAAKGAARTYRRQLNENARETERTLGNVKRRVTQHLGADAVNEAVRSAYNA